MGPARTVWPYATNGRWFVWYAVPRLDAGGRARVPEVETAYRDAATLLDDAGMLPYAPWSRPLLPAGQGRRYETPRPSPDLPPPTRDVQAGGRPPIE